MFGLKQWSLIYSPTIFCGDLLNINQTHIYHCHFQIVNYVYKNWETKEWLRTMR